MLLNISNKPTQNENLQQSCLGSLEYIQIENPSSIKETHRNVTSLLVDIEVCNIMVNFFGQRVLKVRDISISKTKHYLVHQALEQCPLSTKKFPVEQQSLQILIGDIEKAIK